ncbi:hypothetical protein RISK_005094 [Rhodopirellula islandica]|uniref:Uncharacterized protein n=1 Tax=Rhodopirellula islandica TaxID=595434 RepID=A0A0J1B8A7_RHOIS|nr:hypothetical protein RISK_005094 [Rhodopirellula islandica]
MSRMWSHSETSVAILVAAMLGDPNFSFNSQKIEVGGSWSGKRMPLWGHCNLRLLSMLDRCPLANRTAKFE